MSSITRPIISTFVEVYREEIADITKSPSLAKRLAERAQENLDSTKRNKDLIKRAREIYQKFQGDLIIEISDDAVVMPNQCDNPGKGYHVMAWAHVYEDEADVDA